MGDVRAEVPLGGSFSSLEERLIANTDVADCWNWTTGTDQNGYGRVSIDGARVQAHRAIWELLVSPIPDGMTIDHLCRNRSCVNPDHMEIVTPGENVLRGFGVSAKAARKTHCPAGHAYAGGNLYIYPVTNHRGCRACGRASARRYYKAKALGGRNGE